MPVVADAHMFAAASDQPLDVMGLLDQTGNMIRVKDNNFTPVRGSEIVDEPVHKQVIATDYFEFDELLAFPNHLAWSESCAVRQILRRIGRIGSKPERVRLVANPQGLLVDEFGELLGGTDSEFAIGLSDRVEIMKAGPARLNKTVENGGYFHGRFGADGL